MKTVIKLLAALAAVGSFAGAIGLTVSASAQGYPSGPVQFIVPWPPGDFEDVLTRWVAEDMQAETGVPTAVVNRPGGGDGPFPGALEVLAAPADGSVIGSFVIGVPVIGPKIGIGIEEDSFEAVGIFLTYPFVLAASGDAPYSTMAELAAHAQGNDVVLGHFGAGLAPTQATFAAAKLMGFEFADESAFDLLDCNTLNAGDADVINTTLALIEPCLGDLNILANIGSERIGKLPDVGTLSEQSGINDLELWNGLFVKKGTPAEVKDKLAAIAEATMMSDRAQELMHETGARVYWQGADDAEARIVADRKKTAEFAEINAN
ncbi:MAG: tripartite tricarboxylate transporter substrate-binding protein [Paracoccaceae bacterium]|nr:tripartite tricarboxylate transporter substrate-binding protein [Paracoccaceae bacterium]MDE2914480.1 tripartite tricarboxylate transporter substrate-binding protein [Paracoccaceae bacterium]